MSEIKLSQEEERAIASFKRLASKWPKSLWLFSASGTLHVMKCLPNGERACLPNDGMDPDYSVASINIQNDGGDW